MIQSELPMSTTPELPEELQPAARALMDAVAAQQPLDRVFADFCAKAYIKPDWAGPASEFLTAQFEGREAELAAMTRVPDLIIELASGHQTLTSVVAFEWAAAADSARMSKLAEALAATHSSMHNPEAVHLMLALATSLAITRYPRAEQMLALAEPQATEEHQESLQEAREWLAAGRVLRGSSQDIRDLWNHRLRRRRTSWTWSSDLEKAALEELEARLQPEMEGLDLYKAIVPAEWWDEAEQRAAEREAAEAVPQAAKPRSPIPIVAPVQQEAQPAPPPAKATSPLPHSYKQDPLYIFFAGGLVGAAALSLVIWISPFELKRSPRNRPAAPVPASSAEAASEPPSIIQADPATPAPPPEQELWRKEQLAKIQSSAEAIKPLFERASQQPWTELEALLSGQTTELPKEDARLAQLLIWLHLDPPANPDLQARLPALLAAVRPDSDTLELWENLSYKGAPLEQVIRNAARRQIYDNAGAWSASQKEWLNRLGWAPPP
jgi:hypothetical protein